MHIHQHDQFQYIEQGEGSVLLLLHGLFGALSNFAPLIEHFQATHRVVVPLLPLYTLPVRQSDLEHLTEFVHDFIVYKNFDQLHLLGNSLGGHLALKYTIQHPERVSSLTLTGSSGLFENAMGDTYPRRGDYEYIRQKVAFTFYDPAMATPELVDELFAIVNEREKVLRVLAIAKSAMRNNVKAELPSISAPTLLVWGRDDQITPPFVAHEFNEHIPNSSLVFIDQCGHAPMMERPEAFNAILSSFFNQIIPA